MCSENSTKINIRFAGINDAESLVGIYKYYAEETAVSFEYVAPDKEEFIKRIVSKADVYPFIVAESEGEVFGYAYASAFLPRPAYQHSVETTLYLRKDCKRKGIGRLLYSALEELLRLQNVLSLNACIAVTDDIDETLNNDSMLFHSKMGYRYVGQFNGAGYKFDRFYNMIWMEKLIDELKAPCPGFVPLKSVKDEAQNILSDFNSRL